MSDFNCRCVNWARMEGELFNGEFHHPRCDGTGQPKSFSPQEVSATRAEKVEIDRRLYDAACEQLKSSVDQSIEIESLKTQLSEAVAERVRLRNKFAEIYTVYAGSPEQMADALIEFVNTELEGKVTNG